MVKILENRMSFLIGDYLDNCILIFDLWCNSENHRTCYVVFQLYSRRSVTNLIRRFTCHSTTNRNSIILIFTSFYLTNSHDVKCMIRKLSFQAQLGIYLENFGALGIA